MTSNGASIIAHAHWYWTSPGDLYFFVASKKKGGVDFSITNYIIMKNVSNITVFIFHVRDIIVLFCKDFKFRYNHVTVRLINVNKSYDRKK